MACSNSLRRRAAVLAVAGWAAWAVVPAAAADESPVIAESPRARITLADYDAEMAKLPPAARPQFAANRGRLVQLLNNLYLNRAAANDARAAGLDRDPVLARQIELAVDKMLAQAQFENVDRQTAAAFDADPDKYLARAREIYTTRPEKFRTQERIRASHILVRIGAGGDDAAKARAESLRAKVVAGAAFGDVARESSEDRSAASNAGDLGFITAKEVDPEFATAAFALKTPGELSPVIKAASGYHVILLHERAPSTLKAFDDVKKEILADVRQAFIESERALYQGGMFQNPAPKVNEDLISKINTDARSAAPQAEAAPPKARR